MGTAAGVAATVRRPVWCGQRACGASPAAGSARRTPPGCAHFAESIRAIDRRFRDDRHDFATIHDRRLSHHTGPAVILIPGASTAARLGARSANLGQTAHHSQAIAHFVDRRSRPAPVGPAGWPNREKTIAPPESWVTRCRGLPSPNHDRRAAPCPARLGAGMAVPAVCGRRSRSVGEAAVALATVAGCHPGEGGVTAATGDTHRSSPTQAVRSQETMPSDVHCRHLHRRSCSLPASCRHGFASR